jgi:hypothetical protein
VPIAQPMRFAGVPTDLTVRGGGAEPVRERRVERG